MSSCGSHACSHPLAIFSTQHPSEGALSVEANRSVACCSNSMCEGVAHRKGIRRHSRMDQKVEFPCLEGLKVLVKGGADGAQGFSDVWAALMKLWAPSVCIRAVMDVCDMCVRWKIFKRNDHTCEFIWLSSLAVVYMILGVHADCKSGTELICEVALPLVAALV